MLHAYARDERDRRRRDRALVCVLIDANQNGEGKTIAGLLGAPAAGRLLLQAIDEADVDAQTVVEILDGIPGAFEPAEHGIDQIREGKGIPLDRL